jgi:phosphoribosylanthranilate isomerase
MTKMTIAEAGRRAMAERNARHEVAEAVRAAPEAVSEREQFEAWRSLGALPESNLLDRCSHGAPRAGEYRNLRVQDDWEVWQAARASTTPATTEAATQPVKVATPLTEEEVGDLLLPEARYSDEMQDFAREVIRAFAEKNGMTLAGGEVDLG